MKLSTLATFTFGIAFFFSINISHGQDLIVTDHTSVNTIEQYSKFSFTTTVKNQGIVSTVQTSARVYLSIDNILSAGDAQIGYMLLQPMAANTARAITETTYQIDQAPGNYYLIIQADAPNWVTETDETNNVFVTGQFTIISSNIDFQIASLTFASTTVAVYDDLRPTYKIQNSGTTSIGSIFTTIYISTDNTLSASDIRLSSSYSNVGVLTSDEIHVPAVAPGSYFLLTRVDDLNGNGAYSETNEGNNIVSKPITIVSSNIDLAVASPAPTATYEPMQKEINFSFALKNNGTTGVNDYQVELYLSPDKTLDQYDVSYASYQLDHFSYYVGPSATISNDVYSTLYNVYQFDPSLEYYVIAKFNSDSAIPESNYTNNIAVSSNTISLFTPLPLSITSASVAGTYNDKANSISVNTTIINPNDGYFSDLIEYRISLRNSGGSVVQTTYLFDYVWISSYSTSTELFTFSITPLPAGTYTLSFECMDSNICGADSYSLPLTINPTSFSLNGSIQSEDGTPMTSGRLFLYKKDASGTIAFTQKVDPVTTSNFNFQIDGEFHTLYFIPDPLVYPNAVPTILGKTTLLNENSFVKLTANLTTPLVVLQIQPLTESGSKIISGTVGSGSGASGGRVAVPTTLQSIEAVPVILLSDINVPVAITYTDATGYYEFKNLPEGNYKVVVSMPLDQPQITSPVVADVTEHNAQIDFNITTGAIESSLKILQLPQILTFQSPQARTYGDASFVLDADLDSGLPATFTSSNPDVATITNNNEVVIVGAGTTTITAYQNGSIDFLAAQPVEQELVVNKASQAITFDALAESRFGDYNFTVAASTVSNLPIIFTSSDPSVAVIDNNEVTIVGAGTAIITAHQNGNENYEGAEPVQQELIVNKAEQSISFESLPVKESTDGSFELSALATSSLGVVFESDNESIASVSGHVVTIHTGGTVNITAYQEGDRNYNAALPVTQPLVINTITGVEDLAAEVKVYPNPTSGVLRLDTRNVDYVTVADAFGKERTVPVLNQSIDLSHYTPGIYLVKFQIKHKVRVVKVVKE